MKSDIFKVIGGVLLCVGTSIGGGILALPIATAQGGFIAASCYMISCWAIMTLGAFLLLEVNLAMPPGSNLITMAKKTLGPYGALLTWVIYLVLLYTLVCAYLSGGADVTKNLFNLAGIGLANWQALTIFFIIVGGIVTLGMRMVDLANRFIMLLKIGSLGLLIFCSIFAIKFSYLIAHNNFLVLGKSLTVIATSFGYAIVIPSLRTYLNSNTRELRLVIFFGSLIPLFIYLLWEMAIFGLIPPHKLLAMASNNALPSDLLAALSASVNSNLIISAANLFTTVTVFTSFFGVSISLIDFLIDGLSHNKKYAYINSRGLAFTVAYIPPILMALFFPRLFQYGISFAGLSVILLLIVLPALMFWALKKPSLKKA